MIESHSGSALSSSQPLPNVSSAWRELSAETVRDPKHLVHVGMGLYQPQSTSHRFRANMTEYSTGAGKAAPCSTAGNLDREREREEFPRESSLYQKAFLVIATALHELMGHVSCGVSQASMSSQGACWLVSLDPHASHYRGKITSPARPSVVGIAPPGLSS